jgi:hypothetical protein
MGIFDKRSNQVKLEAKNAKLAEKIEKEFSKARDHLAVAGFDSQQVTFALRAQPASLGAVTRSIWVVMPDRIVKVAAIPPAYSQETFLLKEVDNISVSTELIPTVAFRNNGRYVTFKADAIPAQYFCGLIGEQLQKN